VSNKTNHWKLGLFVVLCVGLLIGTLGFFGVQRLQRPFVEAYAYFDEAVDGLDVGSPVKFRGIKIGQVAKIRPAADEQHIEVTSHIYVDVLEDLGLRSPEDLSDPLQGPDAAEHMDRLRVQLVSSFLTGISFIQTDFFDPEVYPRRTYRFPTKTPMIDSIPSTMRSLERGLGQSLTEFPAVLKEAKALFADMRGDLSAMQLQELASEARSVVQELDRRLQGLDDMPALSSARAAFDELTQTLAGLRDPQGRFQSMLASLDDAAAAAASGIAGADLTATAGSMRGAASEVRALGQELRRELGDLDRAIGSFRSLMELLERDPGALLRGRANTSPSGR